MTETEILYFFGQMFAAYLIGWSLGATIYFLRQLSESI